MSKGTLSAIAVVAALALGAGGYVWFGAASAQTTTARPGFRTITPAEARQLIETRKDLLIVDARSPEEFQGGSIPGARLVAFWDITKGRHDLPKDKPILLYCAVGGRSLVAAQILSGQGYREIYDLRGGIQAWAAERLPVAVQR